MNDLEHQNYTQTPPPSHPGEWGQFTRQAAVVILLLGVLFLLAALRPLLNLLGITGIFILILSYPVDTLRTKTKLSYSVVVMLVFIPLAFLLFLLLGNVAGWFIANVQSLAATLNSHFELNGETLLTLERAFGGTFNVSALLTTVFDYVSSQLSMAFTFVSITAISFFLAFLFIWEMPANIARSFRSLSDVSQHEFGILIDRLSDVWNGWLRSTVISSVLIGTTTALELLIFGIPYAGIMGVITGFLNLIPTFGPLISYLLIILVAYTQGSSYLTFNPLTLTLLVLGVNALINQVVRLIIYPKLAGKATHLPVFFVILGLVVAATLWGVIGVILIVPLLGTVGEIFKYVLRKINRQDPYPGEQPHTGFWTNEISVK